MNRLSRFWQELKRRKVVRRNTVYAATAFVILELVSIVGDPLKLPDWTLLLVIILLSIGFIISLIASWIYEINSEGDIEKTKPAHEEKQYEVPATSSNWKIATYISFVVIVALIILNVIPRSNSFLDVAGNEKSIAVLPFENMSDDIEFSHLGDAITDEIIMQLYKIKTFEVRSRTSVMQYKNTEKEIPVIGEELNVQYLLGGSAQRHGDQVRIRIHLYHASTDDQIWGDIFEGAWQDIFDIQINVAKQVAQKLKTVLSPEEVKRIETEPTNNVEAYNLYLQGRYLWHSISRDDKDRSVDYYNRALEIDPNFARAHAGLSVQYHQYSEFGYYPTLEVIPQAKEAALKALELDNTIDEALVSLAWIKATYDGDWLESEKAFKHALEINPNSAFAYLGYSFLLSYLGRHDEAILANQKAVDLDPVDVNMRVGLGSKYYFKRDYDRAIQEFRKILELTPDSWYARGQLALALSQKGLYDEAINENGKIDFGLSSFWYLGYIYAIAGKREKAQEILDRYLELSEKEFVPPTNIANVYMGMGEKEKAFEWLEKTYDQREAGLKDLNVNPIYDSLRSDPRFQDLIERMNFPD